MLPVQQEYTQYGTIDGPIDTQYRSLRRKQIDKKEAKEKNPN